MLLIVPRHTERKRSHRGVLTGTLRSRTDGHSSAWETDGVVTHNSERSRGCASPTLTLVQPRKGKEMTINLPSRRVKIAGKRQEKDTKRKNKFRSDQVWWSILCLYNRAGLRQFVRIVLL